MHFLQVVINKIPLNLTYIIITFKMQNTFYFPEDVPHFNKKKKIT